MATPSRELRLGRFRASITHIVIVRASIAQGSITDGSIAHRCPRAPHRPSQWNQAHSFILLISQCPVSGTDIAQPEMLYTPLLFSAAIHGRRDSSAPFAHAFGLDQKQLALSEPEKRLSTLGIGTAAQHFRTTSCPPGNSLGERLNFAWIALDPPQNSTAHYQRG
jgi:hypothetical protein